MQLQIIFPGEYVQGTLFPDVPNTQGTRNQEQVVDDWTTATFLNH